MMTLEQLKEKYGDHWGMNPPTQSPAKPAFKAPAWDKITESYAADPSRLARLLHTDRTFDSEAT